MAVDGRGRAWGLLGGTFDPIHCGHLAIAEQTRDTLGLAGVIFMPAGVPPHKPAGASAPAEHRAAMVTLAIAGNPTFTLSRIELERPGPSYAVDTLERLRADPGGDYVFILSSEAFGGLKTWRNPDRLLQLCRIAVVPRPGYPALDMRAVAEQFPGRQDRILLMDGPRLGHSASDIRRRVREGRSIRYLVPDSVARYIADHDLYRAVETAAPSHAGDASA